jgi:methyl-accepting chemotaxis protein
MLEIIFGPAMAIMSRLRFVLKLGLVGLLFMAPMAALAIYLYEKLDADIKFAERERLGLEQIVAARFVTQTGQLHRGSSVLALNGDAAAKERLGGLAGKVDEKLQALSAVNKRIGSILKTTESFSNLEKRWLDLKAKNLQYTADESFAKHNEFLDDIWNIYTLRQTTPI